MDQSLFTYIYFGGMLVIIFLAGVFPDLFEINEAHEGGGSGALLIVLLFWPLLLGALTIGLVVLVPMVLIFMSGTMVRKKICKH